MIKASRYTLCFSVDFTGGIPQYISANVLPAEDCSDVNNPASQLRAVNPNAAVCQVS